MMRLTSAKIGLVALTVGCIGKDTEPDNLDLSDCAEAGTICTIAGTGNAAYNLQDAQAKETSLNATWCAYDAAYPSILHCGAKVKSQNETKRNGRGRIG